MTEEPGTTSEPPEGGETPDDQGGLSRRKFIGSVAAAGIGGLTLAGVLAACGGSSTEETTAATTAAGATTEAATTSAAGQTTANNSKPFLIGSPYPISGTAAADGEQMKGGSGLAIQQINDRGGVAGRTIEQEIVDTDIFTPEGVTTALNKLVGMEPDAICIGYLIAWPPGYDIVPPYGCPYLNASTSEAQVETTRKDPEKYSMMFQIDPPEIYYGIGIVPFLNNLEASGAWKPSAKSIFILEGDSAYSQAISGAAKDAIDKDGTWELRRGRAGGHGNDRLGPADLEGRVGEPRCRHEHALGAGRARGIHEAVGAESDELARVPPVRRIGAAVRRNRGRGGERDDLGDGHRRVQRRARKAVSAAVPGQVGQARRLLELRLRVRRGLPAGSCVGCRRRLARLQRRIELPQEHVADARRQRGLLVLVGPRERRCGRIRTCRRTRRSARRTCSSSSRICRTRSSSRRRTSRRRSSPRPG